MQKTYELARERYQITRAVIHDPTNYIHPYSYRSVGHYIWSYCYCNQAVFHNNFVISGEEEFYEYVLEKMQLKYCSVNEFTIIWGETETDEEALALYWKLYSEYVEQYAIIVDYQWTSNPEKPDFRETMEKILYRPAMFVGNIDINYIKALLDGYAHRYREIFGPDSFSWYTAFDAFIKQKYDAGSNENWSELIRHAVAGDIDAALEEFRAVYREFSKSE